MIVTNKNSKYFYLKFTINVLILQEIDTKSMKAKIGFRTWYYFKTGWSMYFAFIFAALNTLVVTYYLAIEKIPFLIELFPSFFHYLLIAVLVGIPIMITIGYIHYKKIPAYSTEVDIATESHPYFYKLPPGFQSVVLYPMHLTMLQMLLKLSNNEKITEEDQKQIKDIEVNLKKLIDGDWINKPKRMS